MIQKNIKAKILNEYKNNENEKIFTKQFILMLIGVFSSAIVLYILIAPITELCYSMTNDLSLSGIASGLYVVGGTVSLIFSGYFFRKWGWKKTGIIFLTLHFLTCFLYFLPANVVGLLIIRFIHGFGIGLGYSALTVITTHILPKTHLAEGLSFFYLTEPVALGISSIISILFNGNQYITISLIMTVIFSGIALLCMLLVKSDEPDLTHKSKKFKLKEINNYIDISTLPISVGAMLCCFGYVAILTFSGIYAKKVNLVSAFNYFFLIYMVTVLISKPIFGRLQDKYGNLLPCIIPIILQTICLFLLLNHNELTVYISAIFTALGYDVLYSSGMSIATENITDERRHLAVTTYILLTELALGFGASILGLFSFIGIEGIFLAAGIFTLLSLPICIYSLKINKMNQKIRN